MASFDLEKEMADALARIQTKRPCQKEAVAKAAAGAAPVKRPVASPAASKTLPPVVSPPIKSPDAKKVRLATSEPDEEEDPTPNTLCDSPTPMASSPPGEKGTPVTPRDLTPEFDAMLAAVDKTPVSAQRVQEVMDSPAAELPPYETGSQSFFDDGARLRLGRSESLEDIVCSPHVEDLVRDSSLSLNMALLPYFERGWDPEKFGRYKLEEATVAWLKGLSTIPLKERQTMPEVVADALVAFQDLRTSSEELEKVRAHADKVNNAAAKTAEVKFQTYLAEMLQSGKDQDAVKEELKSRKKLLESWVNQCREKAEVSVGKREAVHVEIRSAFENLVVGLVLSSHKEFKEKKFQAASVRNHDLLKELDAELLMCLDTPDSKKPPRHDGPTSQHGGGEPTPPPVGEGGSMEIVPVPVEEATETPPMLVTNTYEAMKLAIDNVVAASHIPDEVRNAIVGSVHNVVKKALDGGHDDVPAPTQVLLGGKPMDDVSMQPPEKASDVDGSSTQAAPPPADQQVPTIDLAKNEPEVKKADGSLPSGVEAVSKELQRKDTTQFLRANTSELEAEELEKCAVLQDDGTYKYMNKRGKLETLEEREKRLAHNSYVSFSRSFDGPGCPKEVLQKAAGRKHNRHLLQQLYEDWLCAKGDWTKTATYSNACEQFNSTKRGRFVYKSFKELTESYGLPIAKDIRLKKKEAEKSRAAHEEAFWLKHPEVPDDEEFELFRVWDSLVLEDEETKRREWGVRHEGHMEGEESRRLLQRLLSDKGFAGSFPQPGDAKQREALPPGEGASPGQNAPKAKARRKAKKGKGGEEGAGDHQDENPVVKHNKKVSSKITSLSTKLTEVRCIMTQVQSANMTQAMKDGYMGELTAIQDNLNRSKMDLEDFYSQRHDDKNIVGELKDKMDKLIGSADTIILSFASGTKIVKAAVAPPKQRAKAKAAPTSPNPSLPAAVTPAVPGGEAAGGAAVKQEAA